MLSRKHPLREWIFAALLMLVMFMIGAADTVLAQPPGLDTFDAKVVGVSDGDTLTVIRPDPRNPGRTLRHRVRLAEIDTPEKAQPYGAAAKQALSDLVFNRTVRIEQIDVDRYGRLVAHVYAGDTRQIWANARMVRSGHAWVYRRYARSPELFQMEDVARRQRAGLWSLPESERTPPWEWRHARR